MVVSEWVCDEGGSKETEGWLGGGIHHGGGWMMIDIKATRFEAFTPRLKASDCSGRPPADSTGNNPSSAKP